MKPIFKIRENLFVENNQYIISYETMVAEIVDGTIHVNAKYSRTTTKHIHEVASLFGISRSNVIDTKLRGSFYQFEFGVRCKLDNTISTDYSMNVLSEMRGGKSMFQAFVLCAPTKRKDKTIINSYFESIGYDLKSLQDSRDLGIVFA